MILIFIIIAFIIIFYVNIFLIINIIFFIAIKSQQIVMFALNMPQGTGKDSEGFC